MQCAAVQVSLRTEHRVQTVVLSHGKLGDLGSPALHTWH